ncbi:acyl carrier protein phosphodiesterase [Chamaesiphon sp. VAR_69_metabat_338]|uniref:acyl carrier protein phosphodiesterase n=1 Tax=Chamaesiphon sp. VAR_69_metabat_338 TaxID=2964704 RepID=UPI00286DA3C2|nr:acyl carrier protein phosphodiesterase [Chamaesiphon sp. VAR_69_metabat_338]
MNWLAHILLSEPNVENRLGNLLGDLVKGRDLDRLNYELRRGVARHYAIDKFTDNHATVRTSKQRIDREYGKFAGILIDVFYDHLLVKNWDLYSDRSFADFTSEIYNSFQNYPGEIPQVAKEVIERMIDGDWLSSYRDLAGVEHALNRIDVRIQARMGDRIKLATAMPILEREYSNLDRDFNAFFPELQAHLSTWQHPEFPARSRVG